MNDEAPRSLQNIQITSTFTGSLLQAPLQFWMDRLGIAATTSVAGYAQVLQQLVDADSPLARNPAGFNILLVRLEDWIPSTMLGLSVEEVRAHLDRISEDFAKAVEGLSTRTSAATFVFFGPSSSEFPGSHVGSVSDAEARLLASLSRIGAVHCWTHADLMRLYPLDRWEDPTANQIGHIPYTNDYFVAMATLMARRIAVLRKPPYKVIAVDCDNTLWKGICGEDGPSGIVLTPAHVEFQRMLVKQHDAGMLICLCSKNNPIDVEAVFAQRSDMPLKQAHLVTARLNWSPKSENLRSIAQELNLSPDSFVFVDDNPMECAEVRAHSPPVLTLQFPVDEQLIGRFMDHVWAFDRVGVTEDGRRRTAQYKENRARQDALVKSENLAQFLESLDLQVDIQTMRPDQLPRVAELVQRTNQFNTTAVRRTGSEIESGIASNEFEVWVVSVRDRFGDYGLVGAVFCVRTQGALEVDTFVLSCRVLGRGVEFQIVRELGRKAREEERSDVVLRYRETRRNVPARDFLRRAFSKFESVSEAGSAAQGETRFVIPAVEAEGLVLDTSAPAEIIEETPKSKLAGTPQPTETLAWVEAGYQLCRVADIVARIQSTGIKARNAIRKYVEPRNPEEAKVASIWATLLGIDRVGSTDDFFDLGGDSLRAVQVIARIESELGLQLSAYDFFQGQTVAEVAAKLSTAARSAPAIAKADRSGPLALSWAQQRLWFIDQLEGGSTAYHVPLGIRFRGELDAAALEQSLGSLVQRHEVLRTHFVSREGQVVQEIERECAIRLVSHDLSGQPQNQRDSVLARRAQEELGQPFDLSTGPLVRAALFRLSAAENVLLISMHHTVSDGWSIGVMIRELATLYQAHRGLRVEPLPALPIQYADYAQWQRAWLTGQRLQNQLSYWKAHLAEAPVLLELPTDRPRPATQSFRGGNVKVVFDASQTAAIKRFAREQNVTLAMTLYAGWSVLLSRLSGQSDIVIGVPVANRRRMELEQLVGLFVNTLPVRVKLNGSPCSRDLLSRVKESLLGAYEHQDIPFEQVVEAVQPARSLAHSPLFQNLFVMLNAPRDWVQLQGLSLIEEEVSQRTAQFDLTLTLRDDGDALVGTLNYAVDLFSETTIERWVTAFKALMAAMIETPDLDAGRLPLMSSAERRQILEEFNSDRLSYPPKILLHEMFEDQARLNSTAVALEIDGAQMSYTELNCRANQLARYLRRLGAGPDQRVGICAVRSFEMVVGLFGILKSGAAYVPLDPTYPAERLQYMLADSAPGVLLIQESLRDRIPPSSATLVALDSDWSEIATCDSTDLDRDVTGHQERNLAYVIYTSGSTGRPKGAMNEHRAVVNRVRWMQTVYPLSSADRVLQKTPFSFDVSVWEFFCTLSNGARLVLARPEGHRDPAYLSALMESAGITMLHFVPSMLQSFLEHRPQVSYPSLRRVLCSGEELPVALKNRFLSTFPGVALANLYGPTETAVEVTAWDCRFDETVARVPIGRPISNVRMYVLDEYYQPVPLGVVGEIYIGGSAVGRGYLNQPQLTAERFVADPFAPGSEARLYKTGDLGKWRPDGSIEYLGRNDHQVKIRGFRIELGEIESQLLRLPQVREAVVVAKEGAGGQKRLVAYLTANDEFQRAACNAEALRSALAPTLPEHMIPTAFVVMEQFPLNANGKLDRRSLPEPGSGAFASQHYEPPQGELEEVLAGIWQSLLGLERVGRRDSFFLLGGHSLLIMEMMERLNRVGLFIEVRQVFETPTLAELAASLSTYSRHQAEIPPNLIPAGCEAITPDMLTLVDLSQDQIDRIVNSVPGGGANVQDVYPLAPLQQGMLFHHLLNEHGADTYVVATLLSVSSRDRLDQLVTALQRLVDRHDMLRTSVMWEHLPQPVQVVWRKAALHVTERSLDSTREPLEQLKQWMSPQEQRLDLRQAPLMRLQIAEDPRSTCWFAILRLHHIIDDGASLEVMISEIVAHMERHAVPTSEPTPYRNHIAAAMAFSETHDVEAFFKEKLGDVDETTAPFGLLDVHADGKETSEAFRELKPNLAQRLRRQAGSQGVSVATLFHAGWGLVVAHTSGRDDVVFGSVLLGRMNGATGANRVVGMFINTLPVRLKINDRSIGSLVEGAQRELVDLITHEQASLAVAQRCSAIGSSTPLFTAQLNFRHGARNAKAQWEAADGVNALAYYSRTNYPVAASIDDLGDNFSIRIQTHQTIDPGRVADYLVQIMESIAIALDDAPQTPAMLLKMMPQEEFRRIVAETNRTEVVQPRALIHRLFENQVALTPDALAVTYKDRSLTYRDLNARSNQLARTLRQREVGPDRLVALCVDRSPEMLVGILAVLKAGGAYVPLDPANPGERLQLILTNAKPALILTQRKYRELLSGTSIPTLEVDSDWDVVSQECEDNLEPQTADEGTQSLAYVIYTSGSTGTPKGVMVEHHSIVNYASHILRQFDVGSGDGSLLSTSISFDLGLTGLYPVLLAGKTVRLCPEEQGVPDLTSELNSCHDLAPLKLTPSHLGLLEPMIESGALAARIRVLALGGETLQGKTVRWLAKNLPGTKIFNHYGPTEATVGCVVNEISDGGHGPVPIGKPISNTQVYVLDRHRQPVPVGVVGEIYVAGEGVARGYLSAPELTAERFVANPFATHPGKRMYRTGDLGRIRPDGLIECLGRSDGQVKIRGHRIELGEIESHLRQYPTVKEAVVLARNDDAGQQRLVAYLTTTTPSDQSDPQLAASLRSYMKDHVPDYMVPSAWVVLDRLPITSNGKLDRRALPDPQERSASTNEYEPPHTEIEKTLAQMWSQLLRVERIGLDDDFFELGGHSLLAMQVIVRLQSSYSIQIPLRLLFDCPTVRTLAERIDALRYENLLTELESGADNQELLESVTSISESRVQELIEELTMGRTP